MVLTVSRSRYIEVDEYENNKRVQRFGWNDRDFHHR